MEGLRGKRKVLSGKVVSDKMQKTVIVEVERKFRHPIYRKVIRQKNKFKVHSPSNEAHIGDFVEIMETRPISKEKRWRITKILRKTKGVSDKSSQETASAVSSSGF